MNNQWEDRYQQGQTGWDRGAASDNLFYWINNKILKPCRILIPGCGNGYEAIALAQQGFEVVAIDIAPTPVKNLREALDAKGLQAEVIQADFFKWRPDKPFDAIYEQTSLCALPPELWLQYEDRLFSWLKPGGQLFAHFMQTGQDGGPPFHCEIGDMRSLFTEDRWKWSKQHHSGIKHSKGKVEELYLLEKKT